MKRSFPVAVAAVAAVAIIGLLTPAAHADDKTALGNSPGVVTTKAVACVTGNQPASAFAIAATSDRMILFLFDSKSTRRFVFKSNTNAPLLAYAVDASNNKRISPVTQLRTSGSTVAVTLATAPASGVYGIRVACDGRYTTAKTIPSTKMTVSHFIMQ